MIGDYSVFFGAGGANPFSEKRYENPNVAERRLV
jgi:hypothetical protein